MSKIIKEAAALTIITLVAGLLLGLVYEITKAPIAHQEELEKKEAYEAVFADAADFETVYEEADEALQSYLEENGYDAQVVNEVMIALDENQEQLGYAFSVTDSEGYGGDISLVIGIQDDGKVNGISILSISETAGLGMKADTEEFKSQFAGKQVEQFEYTKSGAASDHEIDALSGATITTSAVTNGVNAGLCAFQYMEGGSQ